MSVCGVVGLLGLCHSIKTLIKLSCKIKTNLCNVSRLRRRPNSISKVFYNVYNNQKRNFASLFAFSAFLLVRILPLHQFVMSWRICSNMRNDSGHVVWPTCVIPHLRFRILLFAFRNSAFYPLPQAIPTKTLKCGIYFKLTSPAMTPSCFELLVGNCSAVGWVCSAVNSAVLSDCPT